MNIKIYSIILCFPLLLACQSNNNLHVKQNNVNKNLYLDSQFQSENPLYIETEQEIFALNDDMRAMVNTKLLKSLPSQKKAIILLKHLFEEENIALSYDGNANFTASQAYDRKVANCMSLTIMSYVLAEAAGMNVTFREVDVPEYWVRNGQYNFLTGHVNLLVLDDDNTNSRVSWGDSATKIDFDPFVAKKTFPSHRINKQTLLAMFYNNKGAEALVKNHYLLAYQYLKKATQSDGQFSSAWGNLGVLYKLTGHTENAEFAYIRAISLQHDNLNSLGNLAYLLNNQNRASEALPIEEYIQKLRIKNPYYHALLGDEALFNQSYQQALLHYKKAIQLDDNPHEFYFGLAKAYYKQGELTLSKRAMKKAVGHSKFKKIKSQYVAKLNFLNGQEQTQH